MGKTRVASSPLKLNSIEINLERQFQLEGHKHLYEGGKAKQEQRNGVPRTQKNRSLSFRTGKKLNHTGDKQYIYQAL